MKLSLNIRYHVFNLRYTPLKDSINKAGHLRISAKLRHTLQGLRDLLFLLFNDT